MRFPYELQEVFSIYLPKNRLQKALPSRGLYKDGYNLDSDHNLPLIPEGYSHLLFESWLISHHKGTDALVPAGKLPLPTPLHNRSASVLRSETIIPKCCISSSIHYKIAFTLSLAKETAANSYFKVKKAAAELDSFKKRFIK